MYVTFTGSLIYLNWVLVVGCTGFIDLCLYSWKINFSKSVTNTLMIERKANGSLDNIINFPKSLQKYIKLFKKMNNE